MMLSTGRLLPLALLPVNHPLLLVREKDLLALFVSQFCPSHIRIREIANLEARAAKVGVSQVRPHKIDFAEKRSTEITSRKVGVGEVDLIEVIPAQGGLGQVRVLERNRSDLRPTKEGARESQVFQIMLACTYPCAEEGNPKRCFIIALRAVIEYGRDHPFGSCIRVAESLEQPARLFIRTADDSS
jgi:hypothetical protein